MNVPRYDHECNNCNFVEELWVDYDSPREIECPRCHKNKSFKRLIGTPTMLGVPKTLGSLAEANTRKRNRQ